MITTSHPTAAARITSLPNREPAFANPPQLVVDLGKQPEGAMPPASSGILLRYAPTFYGWLTIVPAFLRHFFGRVEYVEGEFCDVCTDVHADGEDCPRATVGDCDICLKVVTLDRFLNCPAGRYHRVLRRRAKPRAQPKEVTPMR